LFQVLLLSGNQLDTLKIKLDNLETRNRQGWEGRPPCGLHHNHRTLNETRWTLIKNRYLFDCLVDTEKEGGLGGRPALTVTSATPIAVTPTC